MLNDCIYGRELFREVVDASYWGSPAAHPAIDGGEATREAEASDIRINGSLLPGCMYVFRWNLKRTALIPARVTMHPRTAANIMRGSKKYGLKRIAAEF